MLPDEAEPGDGLGMKGSSRTLDRVGTYQKWRLDQIVKHEFKETV